jgi:hypothetical protein
MAYGRAELVAHRPGENESFGVSISLLGRRRTHGCRINPELTGTVPAVESVSPSRQTLESGTMAATVQKVTDADILTKLDELGGNVSRTAKELKVRKARVVEVNAAAGNPAEDKKRKTVFEAAEEAVIHLGGLLANMTKRDGAENAKGIATSFGIAVDKLLLIAGKPIAISQSSANATSKTVNVNDLLDRLERHEIEQLLTLRDKANGIPEPEELSDLDNPEVYSDDDPEFATPVPNGPHE